MRDSNCVEGRGPRTLEATDAGNWGRLNGSTNVSCHTIPTTASHSAPPDQYALAYDDDNSTQPYGVKTRREYAKKTIYLRYALD